MQLGAHATCYNTFMDTQCVQFLSHNVNDTMHIGTSLGQHLQRGDIVLLSGDLGAGKTHFSKGVVAGIGSFDSVTSPTFVFINEYRGPQRLPIFHADLYRITTPAELSGIGIDDATDGSGICLIEWPERDPSLVQVAHIAVHMTHAGSTSRRITMRGHGVRPLSVLTAMAHTTAIHHLQESPS